MPRGPRFRFAPDRSPGTRAQAKSNIMRKPEQNCNAEGDEGNWSDAQGAGVQSRLSRSPIFEMRV
jgi:hypothetical protein